MKIEKWIELNTEDLNGKTVVITGASGGLGTEVCKILARLNAHIIMVDHVLHKGKFARSLIMEEYPSSRIDNMELDLEKFDQVESFIKRLTNVKVDYLILNAGAYATDRHKTSLEYDDVFQINFVSNYYIIKSLLQKFKTENTKIIAVGSIAHKYSKIDDNDIDFSTRKKCNLVYGNSKRFLMFSLHELLTKEHINYAIVHPGISFTNITSHYPKALFALIKLPMKLTFMKPNKACLSIIKGIFENTAYHEWIGPKRADIWGYPIKKKLSTVSLDESKKIFDLAEKIYDNICNKQIKIK